MIRLLSHIEFMILPITMIVSGVPNCTDVEKVRHKMCLLEDSLAPVLENRYTVIQPCPLSAIFWSILRLTSKVPLNLCLHCSCCTGHKSLGVAESHNIVFPLIKLILSVRSSCFLANDQTINKWFIFLCTSFLESSVCRVVFGRLLSTLLLHASCTIGKIPLKDYSGIWENKSPSVATKNYNFICNRI